MKRGQYFRKPKDGYALIYKYLLDNGKSYIGQTTQNLVDRHYKHKSEDVAPIDKALKEHQYELVVLCEVPLSEADEMERHYITEYNSLAPNGYNYTTGGKKGGSGCEEWSKNLSESLKGKPKSEEHRAKILENNKNTRFKKGNEPWNKGTQLSPIAYEKARPTMFKKNHIPHNIKSVRCVETGKVYPSITVASKETGAKCITDCLKGRRNKSGGYHWEEVN